MIAMSMVDMVAKSFTKWAFTTKSDTKDGAGWMTNSTALGPHLPLSTFNSAQYDYSYLKFYFIIKIKK